MANGNVFNLGQSLTAGQRYKAGQMGLQQQSNIIANRKKANEIRQQYDAMPEQVEMLEQQGLFDEANKLRDNYLRTQRSAIATFESVGRMVSEEDYQQFRSDMIRSGSVEPTLMPTKYKKDWWKREVQKQKGKLSTHTRRWGEQGAVMAQDLVSQDGQVIWGGDPYKSAKDQPKAGSGGKPFRVSASDRNAIRSSIAQLYGAIWDPKTGKYGGLNRNQEKEVAAINEQAAKIYNANQGNVTHAEAVARAARKMNIQIQNLEIDPNNRDPLGIRR